MKSFNEWMDDMKNMNKIKSVFELIPKTAAASAARHNFMNEADFLIEEIEEEIKNGYKLSSEELKMYDQIKAKYDYINNIEDEDRYYGN